MTNETIKNKTIKNDGTTKKVARALALALLALLAVGAARADAYAQAGEGKVKRVPPQRVPLPLRDCDGDCQDQMNDARAATAKYHDVNVALADGFIPTPACVAVPGLGAMGIHYINPLRLRDTNVSATEPEALLYVPQADGTLRLVGLEYVAPVLTVLGGNVQPWFGGANNPPPNILNPAPSLFGQSFDAAHAGHGPGEPWHYDLHVWAWRHNPSGTFFPFNPKLTCAAQ